MFSDAPDKWLNDLKAELGLLKKRLDGMPQNSDTLREERNEKLLDQVDEKECSYKLPHLTKSVPLARNDNRIIIPKSAEGLVSDRTLEELKKEMLSAEREHPANDSNFDETESDEENGRLRKAVRSQSFTDLKTAIEV
ncbi:unnamed protein product [Anisakis simplex]|uniref:Fibrous sheath-interacting protein 1 n=1 Tax=Anisakis simplex TaxID=6269 RepID=A0A0M3JZF6_ANISI|nr:unnamed protein product [Anisakis simplex]